MRRFWQVSLCCVLATGIGMAQRGGGAHMGGGGGGIGFPGGFPGNGGLPGNFGSSIRVRVNPVFFSNGVVSNPNVSAPFGLGLPASPAGFPSGLVFSNGRFFPSTIFPNNLAFPNNAFFNFQNQRFGNNGFWGGGFGWGWGVEAVPQMDPLSLPSQLGNAWIDYPAPAMVVAPPVEAAARPVRHEYDQSGKEVQLTATTASGAPNHSVIHEYDADGKEITPTAR